MGKERSMEITEQEMPVMRNGVPKEDAYIPYVEAARKLDINALEERGTFIRFHQRGSTKGTVCINGRVGYTANHKPLKAVRAKTESHMASERWPDARCFLGGFQDGMETTSPPHTA